MTNQNRVRIPATSFDGKQGPDAPGEREIRRKEFSERVYENIPNSEEVKSIE